MIKHTNTRMSMSTANIFTCPVPECNNTIENNVDEIKTHIKNKHTYIYKIMCSDSNIVMYCEYCDLYINSRHYHCYECNYINYFYNKEKRDTHLKTEHLKWWFEINCNYKKKCRGFNSGICGFNHHSDISFIADGDELSNYVCKYDKPWDGVRCNRLHCSYDHFWGRVRAIIKKKNNITKYKNNNPSSSNSIQCVYIDDDT